MQTLQEILMIIIAAMGLLIAATGCTGQAGPPISGRHIPAPSIAEIFSSAPPCSEWEIRESGLYAHSARALILAETLAACASHEVDCTEEDSRALKTNAETSLQDIISIITSGDKNALALTAQESEALRSWAREVSSALSQAKMPDDSYKNANVLISLALQLIEKVIA